MADFYVQRQCVAGGNMTLKVTNYDYGSGQQYHWSVVGTARPIIGVFFDANVQSNKREGYVNYASQSSSHRISLVVGNWLGRYKCTFDL